jgi:hypothetical protein
MASPWGGSWGNTWLQHWLIREPAPEPEPPPPAESLVLPAGASGGFRGRGERGVTARYPKAKVAKPEPRLVEKVLAEAKPSEPGSGAARAIAGALDEADRALQRKRQVKRNRQITGLLLQLIAMED